MHVEGSIFNCARERERLQTAGILFFLYLEDRDIIDDHETRTPAFSGQDKSEGTNDPPPCTFQGTHDSSDERGRSLTAQATPQAMLILLKAIALHSTRAIMTTCTTTPGRSMPAGAHCARSVSFVAIQSQVE